MIRPQGRATQGVKIINLKTGDKLVALGKVNAQSDEDEDELENEIPTEINETQEEQTEIEPEEQEEIEPAE